MVEMVTLPNGEEVPFPALVAVVLAPLVLITIITMVVIGPALSLGLLAIMAITAGIVWLGSRGTDWMEPLDDGGELE